MRILAMDPGSKESAYLCFDSQEQQILSHGFVSNEEMLGICINGIKDCEALAIESIEGFGITAGQEIFDTCWWSGRFCEAFIFEGAFRRMGRKEVKSHICGHTRAQDKDIREALIYRFGDPGKKSTPGKLYGVAGHGWAALAVAVTFSDLYVNQEVKLKK